MFLRTLRKKRVAKRIFWTLIILILPAFLLWGSGAIFRGLKGPKFAGYAFGRRISLEEYLKHWQACRNQALLNYGDKFNQVAKYLNLQQKAWDRLILLKEARRRNLKTKDQEVIEWIKGQPAFQREGSFDRQLYNRVLEYGLKIPAYLFEEQVKGNLMISKLYQRLTDGIQLTDEQLKKLYKKENEKVKVSYLFIPQKDLEPEVTIGEEELKDFFARNPTDFMMPPQVNIEYVGLDFEDLGNSISIEEGEIQEYYNTHKQEFQLPDSPEEFRPFEDVKEDIRERLVAFESRWLAEERMKDLFLSLKEKGTVSLKQLASRLHLALRQTGLFTAKDPIPGLGFCYQFSEVAFQLAGGEISQPVKTQKGIYILRLVEKKEPYVPEFGQVRQEAEERLRQVLAKQKAKQKAEEILKQVKQLKASTPERGLAEITNELSLKIDQTDYLSRGSYIPKLGISERFYEVAFELKEGQIADEVVETEKGYCILKLDKFLPIDEESFLEEKDAFRQRRLNQNRQEFFQRYLQGLRQKAELKSNL